MNWDSMLVISISDASWARLKDRGIEDGTVAQMRGERDGIIAAINCPIELSYVQKVAGDPKTDRYYATFIGGDKTAVLKCTDEVAAFLTTHLREHGSWVGRIEKGVLVHVCLLQP